MIVFLHSFLRLGSRPADRRGPQGGADLRGGRPRRRRCWWCRLCNAKLRRTVQSQTAADDPHPPGRRLHRQTSRAVTPRWCRLSGRCRGRGRTASAMRRPKQGGVDLTKAEIIVSAGRGVGKPENVAMVAALAKALGGEYGASRPVVDAGWVEHNRQVGTTGRPSPRNSMWPAAFPGRSSTWPA